MKVSIIIPIHNIVNRRYNRVLNSLISLEKQSDYIDEIIIVDSSDKIQYNMLAQMIRGYSATHIHYPQPEFNKPLLLNTGIKAAKSKWIMCTDADYLFRDDFLNACEKQRREDRIMFKEVRMLPNMGNISQDRVISWKFPNAGYNIWGHQANGACQYTTKEFFTNNPYPEEMSGFGAMDNIMAYIAYNNGLQIYWIPKGVSEILHQYHAVINKMGGNQRAKFDRNQKVLNDYITNNNLPCLLTK